MLPRRDGHCRCCGIGIVGSVVRAKLRVCIGCDDCDELHGSQLQAVLWRAVEHGKLNVWTAIARSMIDDGQLSNRLVYTLRPDQTVADMWLPAPVPRGLVVAARDRARGVLPDVQSVVDAALARFIGTLRTEANMREMSSELRDALQCVDPGIMDVEITTSMTTLDPGHLVIKILAKTPTLGVVTIKGAEDVAIPEGILSGKRAEA